MPKKFFREVVLSIVVLAVLLILAHYDIAFLGKTFKVTTGNPQALASGPYGQENNRPKFFSVHSTDVCFNEEPIREFIRQSLRRGIVPLWNPHLALGYDLTGMMHFGLFFPLHFILYFLPQTFSWDIMIWMRFLVGGIFMYWFMRTLRFRPIPALGAALTFALSGPMVLFHWAYVNVVIVVPLYLACLEQLIQKPNVRNSCFLAVAIGLMFLAGHAEHIVLDHLFGGLYFAVRVWTQRKKIKFRSLLQYSVLGYLLGIGLGALVLLPFLYNWTQEIWHSHATALAGQAEAAVILKETLVTFIMPYFFQKEIVTAAFDRYSFWGHIGIIPIALACLSLCVQQRRGLNYFLAFCAFAIFCKSHVPYLFDWVGYLPLLKVCRFYHHTQHLFVILISILAGMGIDMLFRRKDVLRYATAVNVFLLVSVAAAFFYYRNVAHFNLSLAAVIKAAIILVLLQAIFMWQSCKAAPKKYLGLLLVAVLYLELFSYIPRERVNRFDSFPANVPYLEFIKSKPERDRMYGVFWTFYPNTAAGYDVDDFGIVDGVLPRRFVGFVNEFLIQNYFKQNYGTTAFWVVPMTFIPSAKPYAEMLNVRYTIAPKNLARKFPAANEKGFPAPVYDVEVKIYENPRTLPRTFIVHKAVFEPNLEALAEAMKKNSRNFPVVAFVGHEPIPEIVTQLAATPLMDKSSSQIVKYSPNEIVIQADVKSAGLLVLSDAFHPSWKAFVDGQETKIFVTNYLIRSVFVAPGVHEVRFSFQPGYFFWGVWISAVFLLILIFLFRKKK